MSQCGLVLRRMMVVKEALLRFTVATVLGRVDSLRSTAMMALGLTSVLYTNIAAGKKVGGARQLEPAPTRLSDIVLELSFLLMYIEL